MMKIKQKIKKKNKLNTKDIIDIFKIFIYIFKNKILIEKLKQLLDKKELKLDKLFELLETPEFKKIVDIFKTGETTNKTYLINFYKNHEHEITEIFKEIMEIQKKFLGNDNGNVSVGGGRRLNKSRKSRKKRRVSRLRNLVRKANKSVKRNRRVYKSRRN